MAKRSSSADEAQDPTVRSGASANFPEGAEPAPPIGEADDAAVNKQYRDMPDDEKPDPSTVAQLEVRPDEEG